METPNIYASSQIYAIRSHQTPEIYIGSTTQPLHKRFHHHKRSNKCSSKIIMQYTDAYIELIENFPCGSKKELNKREGQHIRGADNCVNKNIAGRTQKEYNAKIYAENRDQIAERQAIYYANNREKIAKYNAENKEKIAESHAKYNAENREKIAKRQRENYAKIKATNQEKGSGENSPF